MLTSRNTQPDRLADEELALIEHRRGQAREQREVDRRVAQLPQLREQGGALRLPNHAAGHVSSEPVDMRPVPGQRHEAEEPGEITLLEQGDSSTILRYALVPAARAGVPAWR